MATFKGQLETKTGTSTSDVLYPKTSVDQVEGLPTPTSSDSGKVVGVNSSGQYVLTTAGGTDTSDATLNSSSQMLNGVTAYSKGVKYTGNIPSVTGGTPTATKGTVSNHSISVTPSVTNTTGYITGSTKTGTAVTVSASELVSGNINLTNTSSTNVTNYATAKIVDNNLVAGNIKNGTTILGVTGTYSGGGGDTPPVTPTDAVIFYSKYPFSLYVYNRTKNWDGTLYYSYDDSLWDTWSGTTTLNADLSDGYYKLYLRGVGNTKITGVSNSYSQFVFIGSSIKCCGNLNKLLSYNTTPTLADYAFAYLFYNDGNIDFDVTLPATTLSTGCYYGMFMGCSSMVTAPSLPAITLANSCYYYMFRGCISLTATPTFSATTLAVSCYQAMFYGCFSLTTVSALPVTTLYTQCYYQMFTNCISLTTAPDLPATTLAENCYYMMFNGCTALTRPAKMAGGTTQATSAKYCCQQMYYGCTSLNIYTSASGHTAFYKGLTYSTTSSATNYRSSYRMFYNCKVNGTTSTADFLTAGTQYYY